MRNMLMSFFVFLCIAVTGLGFHHWQSNVYEDEYAELIPLNQVSTLQTLSTPNGERLVPEGALMGTNDVTEVIYQYLVDVEENHTLEVSVDDVYLSKNGVQFLDEYQLLQFDFAIEMVNETQARVAVSVRLNMPENKTQYEMITGSEISFGLQFNQNEIN